LYPSVVEHFFIDVRLNLEADPPSVPYDQPGPPIMSRDIYDFEKSFVKHFEDSHFLFYFASGGSDPLADSVFRYDICLSENEWFWVEKDSVYWLTLAARPPDTSYHWGWETCEEHEAWGSDPLFLDYWISSEWQQRPLDFGENLAFVFCSEPGCCGAYTDGYTGNTNCDDQGKLNLSDITAEITRVYLEPEVPLCCEENGDVNCDTKINLSDITNLITKVYINPEFELCPCP